MSHFGPSPYAAAINRAAIFLLAMAFKPRLKFKLIDEIIMAVDIRGGRIDGQWLISRDLRIAREEVIDRAMAILSAALRERLPGIAEEMDEAFSDRLRRMLSSVEHFFPTLN